MDDRILLDFAAAAQTDLGQLLNAAAHRVTGDVLARLRQGGHPDIRPAYLAVFGGLQPGGTRITVLAERAGVTRQAMSALVRDVEAVGYVTSGPDPADGRAVLVRLTPRGVTFCVDALAMSDSVTNDIVQALGDPRVDALRLALRDIGANPADPR
ncbi:MAG: MarR family winged helix-turn-helix transcriptional regulator [Pseudolysinimonas sp.]